MVSGRRLHPSLVYGYRSCQFVFLRRKVRFNDVDICDGWLLSWELEECCWHLKATNSQAVTGHTLNGYFL